MTFVPFSEAASRSAKKKSKHLGPSQKEKKKKKIKIIKSTYRRIIFFYLLEDL